MMGKIIISLEDGTIISGTVQLSSKQPTDTVAAVEISADGGATTVDALDFSLPVRAFMKDYAERLNGSKKFALLVAHFAKGELDISVDRAAVIEAWNKMTGLLGGRFNGAHESRAKDSGYIYVPQPGQLALVKKWKAALS